VQYLTILLELLEQHPQLHEQLKQRKNVLAWLEKTALQFKTRHEWWCEAFSKQNPGSTVSQFRSEALELALQEMEEDLPTEFHPSDETDTPKT